MIGSGNTGRTRRLILLVGVPAFALLVVLGTSLQSVGTVPRGGPGSGASATVTASPLSFDLNPVNFVCGTSNCDLPLNVRVTASSQVQLGAVTTFPALTFVVGTDGCGGSTPETNGECDIALRFRADVPGHYLGQLSIATSLGGSEVVLEADVPPYTTTTRARASTTVGASTTVPATTTPPTPTTAQSESTSLPPNTFPSLPRTTPFPPTTREQQGVQLRRRRLHHRARSNEHAMPKPRTRRSCSSPYNTCRSVRVP